MNKNGVKSSSVTWNFQKYLIDEEGQLVDVISPRTQPDDPKIVDWIKS
jgi:glutathione peroxidase